MNDLAVMIPVRSFHGGKTRLAEVLPEDARNQLVRAMLDRVIHATLDSGAADRVTLISPDQAVVDYAQAFGSTVSGLQQSIETPGLNAAADLARLTAIDLGTRRLLILFGDLPSVSPDDIRSIAAQPAPVVIATDWIGGGSNGLMLDLSNPRTHEFTFAYGPDSRWLHEAEALRLGLEPTTIVTNGVAYDLDTVEDFRALVVSNRELPDWLRALPIQHQETIA